ncbi:hypothetical protein LshimejAT787_1204300 [Lyophyllum shimeji]|uniref:Uncharacterized protein n=1 Tax=Lyophyllum shimeji TaxID=47721 RepID=A0A9P3PWM0_LYOSH|nr:hypothetical protein LshimejAT787_1204300 [Lyophyllum shimeji]
MAWQDVRALVISPPYNLPPTRRGSYGFNVGILRAQRIRLWMFKSLIHPCCWTSMARIVLRTVSRHRADYPDCQVLRHLFKHEFTNAKDPYSSTSWPLADEDTSWDHGDLGVPSPAVLISGAQPVIFAAPAGLWDVDAGHSVAVCPVVAAYFVLPQAFATPAGPKEPGAGHLEKVYPAAAVFDAIPPADVRSSSTRLLPVFHWEGPCRAGFVCSACNACHPPPPANHNPF